MAATANRGAPAATSRLSESITSRDNRWLKQFRAALAGDAPRASLGKGHSAEGEIAGAIAGIEGARLVEAALEIAARDGRVEIIAVLSSDAGARHFARLAPLVPSGARLLHTTDRLFAQVAGTQAPQGIAALVRPRPATFDELVSGVPLILVLAGVQDPGNVGVLIRSAEAFGATGAAACSAAGVGTANPFAPKALRASAGAALRLPILRGAAAPVLRAQLRLAGVRLIAACPEEALGAEEKRKALPPWDIDWRGAAALLVGNEGAGLPGDLIRSADQIVEIPQMQRGGGDSLNAAVAGAVLLYEAARQRRSAENSA